MMELWNDFEGKTVDGRFPLDHLIGPKGRSAYFTGRDEAGGPVMIRLIESLNDEEEILGRWRRVTGLQQEHLVEVLACGQTILDGTHLVYAVMETTDAELADVLRERALSADETRQIALSVADGLNTLHGKGLVHEHVEADNVLAKGETVKLRSDVVREAPEGQQGVDLRARDVRDLSLLVLQCMTRSRAVGQARLPAPFEEIVRRGENGSWGLKDVLGALRPATAPVARPVAPVASNIPPAAPRPAAATPVAPSPVSPTPVAARPAVPSSAASSSAASAPAASAAPRLMESPRPTPATAVAQSTAPAAVASRLANQTTGAGDGVGAHLRSPRIPGRIVVEPEAEPRRWGLLASIAAGVLLLVLLGIYFLRAGRATQSRSAVQDSPSAVTVPQQSSENRPPARDPASAPVPQRPEKPSAAQGSARSPLQRSAKISTAASGSPGAQWRVVAFTYNHEDQAAQKAHALGAQHPGLHAEVFSPSGHAPYLVTLGGWMSADQASALRNKARSQGLPRDIYAQNYRGK